MNRKLIAGLVAAATMFIAAPAHAAQSEQYYIEPGSSLKIVDDEWGTDEVETFDLSNLYLGSTSTTGSDLFTISRCAGGEVKVKVHFFVDHPTDARGLPGKAQVKYWIELFEGVTCYTTDLDGYMMTGLRPVGSPFEAFKVINSDEGGDSAMLTIKLRSKIV